MDLHRGIEWSFRSESLPSRCNWNSILKIGLNYSWEGGILIVVAVGLRRGWQFNENECNFLWAKFSKVGAWNGACGVLSDLFGQTIADFEA